MSCLLFMDESGHDLRDSPYEVLAGVCIEDRDLWNFVTQVQAAEEEFFGERVTPRPIELKGKKVLKKKVFRHAGQMPAFAPAERCELARRCIEKGQRAARGLPGGNPTRPELTALAQAKVALVDRLLELCAHYRMFAFASIVDRVADLVAYIVAWGVRVGGMARPAREELAGLAAAVCGLRYRTVRERGGQAAFNIWSFAVIDDLRPREERLAVSGEE